MVQVFGHIRIIQALSQIGNYQPSIPPVNLCEIFIIKDCHHLVTLNTTPDLSQAKCHFLGIDGARKVLKIFLIMSDQEIRGIMTQKIITDYTELEQVLREKIKESGLSTRKLQELVGISYNQINEFKNGKRNMSFQNLWKLADYFGVKFCFKNY